MSSLTTKKAISYALKDLLKTNPFSKITINDIAAFVISIDKRFTIIF